MLRVILPTIVLLAALVMYLMKLDLLKAPVIMLLVPTYWLALIVGIGFTLRFGFVAGVVVAALFNVVFLALAGTRDVDMLASALFAPVIPLAIVQLIAAPFQLWKRAAV